MPDSNKNGTILQPNPYAGGRVPPPIIMPAELQNTGGNAPGNQGAGQNSLIIDDDVSLSGPSAGLNGTPQTNPPYQGGNVQPTTPGTDFINTVPGMMPDLGQLPSDNRFGWRQQGNDWYYFDPDSGAMVKGWKEINNFWYYLDPATGIMATGWIKTGGLWYYLDPKDGHMLIDWNYIGGEWFYLETDNRNGQMVTGWKLHKGNWYFLFENGAMAHGGWVKVDEKWYCFRDPNGEMEASKIIPYRGKNYYVGEDGAMVVNTTGSQLTVVYNGVTYEVDEDGVCTAISMTAPSDADIQAWKAYISNDTSLSSVRKIIVLEALETIEQGCTYHQLRNTDQKETPEQCLTDCDGERNPNQVGDYNYNTMANYNVEDPLYLDCSFFIKHCYWKAGVEMKSNNTGDMIDTGDFKKIGEGDLKTADIALRNGHVMLFVGWTSGHEMVWAEMKQHSVDGRVSTYTPDDRYEYRTFKRAL